MLSNRLQLNSAKTQVFWCSSARRQHQIPTGSARVGDTYVLPVRTVRDLGVYIDADVTVSAHVTAIVKACFAALRQIRSACRSLTHTVLLTRRYVVSMHHSIKLPGWWRGTRSPFQEPYPALFPYPYGPVAPSFTLVSDCTPHFTKQ